MLTSSASVGVWIATFKAGADERPRAPVDGRLRKKYCYVIPREPKPPCSRPPCQQDYPMKGEAMRTIISVALIACALSLSAARAQTQETAPQTQDRQAREQAERDRRQAERERKEKAKEAGKEPGTRCGRWKRGKA